MIAAARFEPTKRSHRAAAGRPLWIDPRGSIAFARMAGIRASTSETTPLNRVIGRKRSFLSLHVDDGSRLTPDRLLTPGGDAGDPAKGENVQAADRLAVAFSGDECGNQRIGTDFSQDPREGGVAAR